jgi:hypothetical protein
MLKKLSALFLTLLSPLSALQVGNPTQSTMINCSAGLDWCIPKFFVCDWMDFRIGFTGDYVFDFPTKIDGENYGQNRVTSWSTNAAYFATNIFQCVDFVSSYGVTEITIQQFVPSDSLTTNSSIREIVTDPWFSWTTGIHATLFKRHGFGIGAGGDYFYVAPNLSYINLYGPNPAYPGGDIEIELSEWQAFLGANYTFPIAPTINIVPYGAMKWNGVYLKGKNAQVTSSTGGTDITTLLRNYDNARLFGYALGLTMEGCNRFSATLEGRFANERAVSFNVQAKY